MDINRAKTILELEKIFNKPVFALIFHPGDEDGIKEGDEKYIYDFLKDPDKSNTPLDCVWILSGRGGNLKTAIICSELLRENLRRYDTFVPTVAGSALCYFILQSNRLFIGNKSKITQMDPMFEYDGEDLRAIKQLSSEDIRKKTLAHNLYNPVFDNLKRIISTPPNVFTPEIQKANKTKTNSQIKLVDAWMGKELHESGLTISDLKRLGINYKVLPDEVIEKTKSLIKECLNELESENQRFVIQTSKIENGLLGGYFYS